MKKVLALAGRAAFVRRMFRPFLKNHSSIFMLHRFAHPAAGVLGHSPDLLRKALEYLRKEGVNMVPLQQLLRDARHGRDISGSVAFTVDDGYYDVREVAAPIFQAYDCPVTVFLTTGFLDGLQWLWWDRIRYAVHTTERSEVSFQLAGRSVRFRWGTDHHRRLAGIRLTSLLERLSSHERRGAMEELEALLEVEVPGLPTGTYAPLTWDQVRDLGRRGFQFGPHTVSHPNLADLSREDAMEEIAGSWERVQAETDAAVPILCFPFGRPWSLHEEVYDYPREVGLEGAVTAEERYCSLDDLSRRPYALPRLGWPETFPEVRHITAGLSRAKDVVLGNR